MLSERPKGVAEIVYKDDDDEAYQFASEVYNALMGAGWNVASPVGWGAAPSNGLPFWMKEAGIYVANHPFLAVLSSDGPLPTKPYEGLTAFDALLRAFAAEDQSVLVAIPHEGLRPKSGVLRIVVGPRL